MPSKLEQLKKEIQRLRPEIMELKFGCDVKRFGRSYVYLGVALSDENSCCIGDFAEGNYIVKKDTLEILGRPITLEDVLAVLGELTIPTKPQLSYNDVCLYFNDRYKWLLGKLLDDQSEETINFLFNLICK